MISLVENEEDKQRLSGICKKTAFGCKIAAIVSSYGFDRGFACFWLDTERDVAYCLSDGVMIISGTLMNARETRAFLHAVGARSVMCAVRNAEFLGLMVSQSGDVLKKQLPAGEETPRETEEVNIREIYSLLEEAGMVEEFEPFYLDLSHRLRHGTAAVLTERREAGLVGCGVVSAISGSASILSALVVREDCRRQGIGSSLVRQAEKLFPGKTLYVFREKERNREFYKKLGYTKADTWVDSEI